MGEEGRIVVSGLSKHFGDLKAVEDLSFVVEPGSVTGFLGPNGAGKTTTLRMVLGLAKPSAGRATIGGLEFAHLPSPGRTVGAVLEATSYHPGRSARNHLLVYCDAIGVPGTRADEVLEIVGLTQAGRMPVRGYSLGMRQRLGLATALLGNPRVLILDEPSNGLDPEGMRWLRQLLRQMADTEGRTILVSSHVLSEVQQMVDRVVILARGRMVKEGTLDEIRGKGSAVIVRTPTPDALKAAVTKLGATVSDGNGSGLRVTGTTAEAVGKAAFTDHVELHELRTEESDLEAVFLQLTADASLGTHE